MNLSISIFSTCSKNIVEKNIDEIFPTKIVLDEKICQSEIFVDENFQMKIFDKIFLTKKRFDENFKMKIFRQNISGENIRRKFSDEYIPTKYF